MINLSYYLLKLIFCQERFQFDTFRNFTFERKFCLFLKNIFRDIFDSLRRFSRLGLVLKTVSELYLDGEFH